VAEGSLMGVGVVVAAEPKLTLPWLSVLAGPENSGEEKGMLDFLSLLGLACDAGSERTSLEVASAVKT
jgi:hypothetical protein